MEQVVKVIKTLPDGTARVLRIRESACSGDCHKCSGCGAQQESLLFEAANSIGAREGQMVVVSARTGPVLAAAAVLYVLPLVMFFLGYALGNIWHRGALVGCAAFLIGIAVAAVYDRKVAGKKKTVYTITGYAHTEGDNWH